MLTTSRWIFLLAVCLPDTIAIINEEVKIIKYPDKPDQNLRQEKDEGCYIERINLDLTARQFSSPLDKCTYKVHHVLGSLSNRRSSSVDSSTLDLSGYALHQSLRSAPYDMYITNMRIRLPYHKQGYIQIDKCRYDDLHKLLQTNMLFRDLTITGNIQLYSDQLGKKLLQEPIYNNEEIQRSVKLGKRIVHQQSGASTQRREMRRTGHRQVNPTDDRQRNFARTQTERTRSSSSSRSFLSEEQWNVQEIDEKDELRKTLFDQLINYNLYYNNNNNNAQNNRYQLPRPVENCNMTLKLKSVGLGFSAIPEHIVETEFSRNINIKTTATYLEPNYISIHAYNCRNVLATGTGAGGYRKNGLDGGSADDFHVYKKSNPEEGEDDLESEMEQVFIKGSRSLLTNYMEKQFKNVLRDSLMSNLGYTVSYG